MDKLEKMESVTPTVEVTEEQPKKELIPIKKDSGWKKFWKMLDGNKTIIGSITLNILGLVPIPEPYKSISMGVVTLLTGAALKHHIEKGFFKTTKGQ